MALDLRTPAQKRRAAIHSKVISEWKELKKQTPGVSNHKRMMYMANSPEALVTSVSGIRKILVESNNL